MLVGVGILMASLSFITGYFNNSIVSIVQRSELLQESSHINLLKDEINPSLFIVDRRTFTPISDPAELASIGNFQFHHYNIKQR